MAFQSEITKSYLHLKQRIYHYVHFSTPTKENQENIYTLSQKERRWVNSVESLVPLEDGHHQFLMMARRMRGNHSDHIMLIVLLERILHTLQMRLSTQPISPNYPIRQSLLLCVVTLHRRMNQPCIPMQRVQRAEKGVHERVLHVPRKLIFNDMREGTAVTTLVFLGNCAESVVGTTQDDSAKGDIVDVI